MNEQEMKIAKLLFNEMAFEGATEHFGEEPPDLDMGLFEQIRRLGIPLKYNGHKEDYDEAVIELDENQSIFENCYRCLRTIRNNIIHANKAYRPDPPDRLEDLLNWSVDFIDQVYQSNTRFSERALEIKKALRIENF
ncbi:hypothetical protein N9L47_09765 [Rhodobacteraceae bacterium]|nr:hypothetical protein [Paracoccaceae bacterium]